VVHHLPPVLLGRRLEELPDERVGLVHVRLVEAAAAVHL
jgi:hypothetical protein